MAKKLKSAADNFIKNKEATKLQSDKSPQIKKIKHSVYLSPEADKLVWQNRGETRETISSLIDRLILNYFSKQKK